jgi:shikimate dehydrogenase
MMMKMALVGSGISRSRMPRLQQHLASLADVSLDYGLIDGENVDGFNPVQRVQQAQADGFHGLNITHPYKQRVYDLVSEPAVAGHQAIGSYNTLKFHQGKIFGANTDYSGFIRGYRFRRGNAAPGRVVLCGAGGVGRAIAFGLAALGSSHIAIFDLVPAQAQSLCDALLQLGASSSVIGADALTDSLQQADGLVNCTALGMYNHPGTAFPSLAIGPQSWAFDAVYTPLETEFIVCCRNAGMQCISGFDLWIFQGIDAFRLFTGVEVEATDELIATALAWLD